MVLYQKLAGVSRGVLLDCATLTIMKPISSNMKNFYHVVANTFIANITTNFLWFALTFWIYLETKSVLATGILGGAYMLLIAICSIWFGTFVDHNKKKKVMQFAATFTMVAFLIALAIFVNVGAAGMADLTKPTFWIFAIIILIGALVENIRNIALSTVVTLLVPEKKRANANGLVGAVSGIGFILTSVFSGLAIGFLGMEMTLVIASVLTVISFAHMLTVKIPEEGIAHDPELANKKVDIKGSLAAIYAIPGLFGLIIFSMLNNLIGGVYMALMDPYGLTLFSVQMWGVVFGVGGTGFVIGGLLIAKFGLGKNPLKTLLRAAIVMGVLGALFTIREWWLLFAIGIWLYMVLVPLMEAAEQTIIQKVVPFKKQGRVFGFAQAFEAAAAPITAFAIAPLAEFWIIPAFKNAETQNSFAWLLGTGEARGIALIFLVSGLAMALIAGLAMLTKTYRRLSAYYATAPSTDPRK